MCVCYPPLAARLISPTRPIQVVPYLNHSDPCPVVVALAEYRTSLGTCCSTVAPKSFPGTFAQPVDDRHIPIQRRVHNDDG